MDSNPLPEWEGDFMWLSDSQLILYNLGEDFTILSCAMEDDLRPRIGTFFILIGLGLLALFVGSDMALQADFWYFMGSVGCIGFGAYLKLVSSREKGPSQRFSAIRNYREKRKKEKEAKKKAKEEQAKKAKTQG
jgi:hypothetical protein